MYPIDIVDSFAPKEVFLFWNITFRFYPSILFNVNLKMMKQATMTRQEAVMLKLKLKAMRLESVGNPKIRGEVEEMW